MGSSHKNIINELPFLNVVWTKFRSISDFQSDRFFDQCFFPVSGFANTQKSFIRAQETQERCDNMNYTVKCNSLLCCARQWGDWLIVV